LLKFWAEDNHYAFIELFSYVPGDLNVYDSLEIVEVNDSTDIFEDHLKAYVSKRYRDIPFNISLLVQDLVLRHCMLDSRASKNIMPYAVMRGVKDNKIVIPQFRDN
jgi:hypothetical protein